MLNSVQIKMSYNYMCSVPYEKAANSLLSDQSAIKKISFIALAVIAAFSFAYVLYRHYFSHQVVNKKQEGDLSSKIKEIPQNQAQEHVNAQEEKNQLDIKPEEEFVWIGHEPDSQDKLDDWLALKPETELKEDEKEPHPSSDDLPQANVDLLEVQQPLNEEQILTASEQEEEEVQQKIDSADDLEDWLLMESEAKLKEGEEEPLPLDGLPEAHVDLLDEAEIEPEKVIPELVVEPLKVESPLSLDQVKEMLNKRGKLQSLEGIFYLRNQKIEGEGVKIEFLKPLFCVIEGRIQEGHLVEGKIRYKGPVYVNPALGLHQWEEHEGHFIKRRLANGTITLSNGTVYSGTFSTEEKYPVLEGKGQIIYPWGAIYKGDFVKGELHTGTMIFPGEVIYEGDFAGDILVKGTITLPSGYKKIGGYNQQGLFEGTLVYTDQQGQQWQREIKEGRISADRTQLNPPEDQLLDQEISDDRKVDNSTPGCTKEIIGEFTKDEKGNLTGHGVLIRKYKGHIWIEEGIFEDGKLIKGKTTYYKINKKTEKICVAFEFDGTYVDKCQGRYVEWQQDEGKIATEMREGHFSLEDLDFFTKLEGLARTKSPKGDRQEGLFKDNRLQQGREIKANGTKYEGYFHYGDFDTGQIFYADGRVRRGKMTSCVMEECNQSILAAAYYGETVKPARRTMEQRFKGMQISDDKKNVKKVTEGILREGVKYYKCAFIDF